MKYVILAKGRYGGGWQTITIKSKTDWPTQAAATQAAQTVATHGYSQIAIAQITKSGGTSIEWAK